MDRREDYIKAGPHTAATLDRPGRQRGGSVPFADTEDTGDNPAYQPREVRTDKGVNWLHCEISRIYVQ